MKIGNVLYKFDNEKEITIPDGNIQDLNNYYKCDDKSKKYSSFLSE